MLHIELEKYESSLEMSSVKIMLFTGLEIVVQEKIHYDILIYIYSDNQKWLS
ncbi:MAG: hypothetical protein A4E24_01040 [Methanomethylovorans sp. PtaU1.Bin093]|jgi:hypothetical protein|nr:MAG: hypothetical protein A4E24_01040 [Methanomethylovorans sp. PtaU1.Bin093]